MNPIAWGLRVVACWLAWMVVGMAGEDIKVTSYFGNGFGKCFETTLVVKKLPLGPAGSKLAASPPQWFAFRLDDTDFKERVGVSFFGDGARRRFDSVVGTETSTKVKVIAFESIQADGVPDFSGISQKDTGRLIVAGTGWSVKRVLVVMDTGK
ncbi:hypothetical protein [Luteolibacter sp. LG18]|uniref:hypothetical protein n=1 Tax=Luteolibacter sp. LG18 TaxID=2819286 RepID=UPI002B2D094E|nr:hypothetical protein llg_00670 [Luteolibacter sp. LG18]